MLNKSDLKAIEQLTRKVVKEESVTKKDAKNFATKNDLIGLARGTEIDNLKIEFLDNLKKWKDEILGAVQNLAGRTQTAGNPFQN